VKGLVDCSPECEMLQCVVNKPRLSRYTIYGSKDRKTIC